MWTRQEHSHESCNTSPKPEVLGTCLLSRGQAWILLHLSLPSSLYHDALGRDPHCLGNLPALVTVRVVVGLEYLFQLLQLVWKKEKLP